MPSTLASTPKLHECGACHRLFPELGDVFSHDCPEAKAASTYRRMVLPTEPHVHSASCAQGTGSGSARPTQADAATEKQLAFLRSLLAERTGVEAAEAIRSSLNADREAGTLGKRQVSKAIESLLKIERAPKAPVAHVPGNAPIDLLDALPAGRYFVADTFVRVDRPSKGSFEGFVFVKRQAHPDDEGIRFALLNPKARTVKVDDGFRHVLDALLADPAAAAVEYGHRTGSCCICGRTLTDPESIAAGIGPICAGKFG